MKTRALILLGCVAAAAFAAQDPVSLVRNYKEGDKDTYKLAVTATMAIGSADINMTMLQTVKKVYENGDADIETLVNDMKMSFGGNEIPMPETTTNPAQSQRVDKFGRPVASNKPSEAAGGNRMMEQMSFLRYAGFVGDKPIPVGSSIDVDSKDEKAGTHTWGKITLVKVESGIATVSSDLKTTNKQTGPKPMSMKFTSTVEMTSGKIEKVSGDITDLPSNDQGMTVDSVKVEMLRVK